MIKFADSPLRLYSLTTSFTHLTSRYAYKFSANCEDFFITKKMFTHGFIFLYYTSKTSFEIGISWIC